MSSLEHVVVVGGGLAGARTCQQLRTQGYEGRITLLGNEGSAPYDRPPLTKGVLLGKRDDTTLPVDFEALGVELHLGTAATGLDLDRRTIETTNGPLHYDGLVIATGASPMTLPGDAQQHVVRTSAEALALREALRKGGHVVIIGASWIGAEIATAALSLDCRVTCLEMSTSVSPKALGEVGRLLLPWWEQVDLRLGTIVTQVGDGKVELADGTIIDADTIVVGIGVTPDVAWLRDSGLTLDRGVVVDERLKAHENVVAVGDVASWWSRRYSRRLLVEHWDNAATGAAVAASTLLNPDSDEVPIYDPVPYFWSDQFGHKVQYLGAHDDSSRPLERRSVAGDLQSVLWLDPDDRVGAVMIIDSPRDMLPARKLVETRTALGAGVAADTGLSLADLTAH